AEIPPASRAAPGLLVIGQVVSLAGVLGAAGFGAAAPTRSLA
ncbi:MAG: hypothetical protein JWM82_3304, partial [Myxococcales bacterium]|nr:hypothetical protein [Myxococcales bacterium]